MQHAVSERSPVRLDPDTESVTFTDAEGGRGRNYTVRFPAAENIVFVVGARRGSALARLEDTRIARRLDVDYERKRSSSDGRKRWSTVPGTNLFIIVPKAAVTLLPVFGGSYPEVEVGGQRIRLNVSGGSSRDGWTDTVREEANTAIGLPVTTVKGLLRASVVENRSDTLNEQG